MHTNEFDAHYWEEVWKTIHAPQKPPRNEH
jgi:hypothetical protein